MNTLIIAYYDGEANFALVPDELLSDYNLDEINGQNDSVKDQRIGDQVAMLFDRLGISPFEAYEPYKPGEEEDESIMLSNEEWRQKTPYKSTKDLMKYRDIVYPMQVNKIISIYIYL
jgi:hypothetical protein